MPDLSQININITDTIPPENFATVDKNALIGTVYTKAQDNEWRADVEATVQSGIKTVLKPNTPYDPVTNPYPTPWVAGNSPLYEKYDVNASGVFPNAKKANGDAIEVTTQELALNEVQIWIKNGVAEKSLKALPQASVNVRKWEGIPANQFPLSIGDQVIKDEVMYVSTSSITINDVPGISNKWSKIGKEDKTDINAVLKYFLALRDGVKFITSFNTNSYLKKDGTSYNTNGSKTAFDVNVKGYNQLLYNCFPAVATTSGQPLYCAILGKKSDGTYEVVRESSLIGSNGLPQSIVNETFDITPYDSISISIGDSGPSIGQIPNIQVKNTITASGSYVVDVVKNYIDAVDISSQKKGPQILNKITSFDSTNTTVTKASLADGILKVTDSGSFAFIKENTLHENSEIVTIYKENTAGCRALFGYYSNNTDGYRHHVYACYNSNGANAGKLEVVANKTLSYHEFSTETNTNYEIGDFMKIGIKREKLTYTFYVQNLTKGWSLKIVKNCTPLGVPFIAHNSASPGVTNYTGSTSFYQFTHFGFSKDIEKVLVGDSITFGQSSSSEALRWAAKVLGNNLIMGGGADTTKDVLSRVDEIIKVAPRRALLMIGGNDIIFNVAAATWKANLISIRNSLVNAGIEVIHCFPTPRVGAATLISFIKTEPTFLMDAKIDTNTPLMNGNSEVLQAAYDSGDNVHPSVAGHAKIADVVNSFFY